MGSSYGYVYQVQLPSTSISTAKTLMQIKAGAASLEIVEAVLWQVTQTATEQLQLQFLRKSAAATVTAFTPLKVNAADPASLAIGGTAATGYNASVEGTDSDVLSPQVWNLINGLWIYSPPSDGRIEVSQTGIIGLKLVTAPAAARTMGGYITFAEKQ